MPYPTCHGHTDLDDQFCRYCGRKLDPPPVKPDPPKPRRGRRRQPLTVVYVFGSEEFTPEQLKTDRRRLAKGVAEMALSAYCERYGTPAPPRDTEPDQEA